MSNTLTKIAPLRRRTVRAITGVSGVQVIVPIMVALLVILAIVGPLIAPFDAVYRSNILDSLQAPSAAHWLGTDGQGRDVFWRIIAGAQSSLLSSVLIVTGFSVLGILVATIATLGGKRADEIVMRIVDAALAFPPIIFALGVAAALGPSLSSAVIAMILTGWPVTARLLRGVMKETMSQPFIENARVLGVSRTRLMLHHVLPNSLDVLVVKWAGDIGNTILILGGLSFVGVGAQPPSAEWGAMVTGAKNVIATAPWAALAPGFAIALTALAFGLLGDILQVRFNPALRRR
ncbi:MULTISPECIES: ABC transporter permease [Arthrobacter]|uniref:ABC transporter permease n=1 Tax=Arthrobacter terricola TaxID=2547396 RepID=A0A4R5KBR1_9MICC|nr:MULTISPECIES: ABC transporter permease [Arthrobacter]MBT8161801.1 ABC transporter permease [Arthrobacter sp. GN70]TDF92643.1 ABC transporter permease [Arthrobacter terricola]